MTRVVITTDDPETLLNWAAKKKLLADDVVLRMDDSPDVVRFDPEAFRKHPFKKFFLAVARLTANLGLAFAAGMVLFTWFMGLVTVFTQFGLQGVAVVGTVIILTLLGLFTGSYDRFTAPEAYKQMQT